MIHTTIVQYTVKYDYMQCFFYNILQSHVLFPYRPSRGDVISLICSQTEPSARYISNQATRERTMYLLVLGPYEYTPVRDVSGAIAYPYEQVLYRLFLLRQLLVVLTESSFECL